MQAIVITVLVNDRDAETVIESAQEWYDENDTWMHNCCIEQRDPTDEEKDLEDADLACLDGNVDSEE